MDRSAALEERDDDELMRLAAADVRGALAELVRRHERGVRAFCRRWDPVRGDDLAQDVFLQLWKTRARYDARGRFRVYLYTLVRNRCRNAWRDFWRRSAVPLEAARGEASSSPAPSQLDALLAVEEEGRVAAAVSRLAPKLREAVLLRFGEGLSHAEIAAIVGAPEVTVRSRVFLALGKLREHFAEVDR